MESTKTVQPEQLKYLYEFCKKKDIQYIELRWEFVDHLSEMIENIWQKEPELSFKEAFHRVYKSFGVFGWLEVSEQHNSIAKKNYWQAVKSHFLKLLHVSNIGLILLVFILIYSVLYYFPDVSKYFWIGIYSSMIFVFIYFKIQTKKLSATLNQDRSMYLQLTEQFFWVMYLLVIAPNISLLLDYQTIVGVHKHPPIEITSMVFLFTVLYIWVNFKLFTWAKIHVHTLVSRSFV